MSHLTPQRRDLRRKINLLVLLPALLLVGMAVGLFVLAMLGSLSAQQITVIAAILMVLFVLLPLALLFLILDALLLLMMFGSGWLVRLPAKPLGLVREYTAQGAILTQQTAERITEPVINVRSKLAQGRYLVTAPLELLLGIKGEQDEG